MWRFLAMLWQAGGDMLDSRTGSKPRFDSPAGVKAMTLLHDMAVTDKSVYLDTGNGNYLNLFNCGKIAHAVDRALGLSPVNTDVTTACSCCRAADQPRSISGPDYVDALRQRLQARRHGQGFLQWLTSAKRRSAVGPRRPATCRSASEQRAAAATPTSLPSTPAEKVFVDNLANVTKVRPNIAQYAEVAPAIGQAVQAVLLGKSAPGSTGPSAKDVKGIFAGSQ